MITREEYEREMGRLLEEAGVRYFTARELAPVGRSQGGVTLQAPPRDLWRNIILTVRWADWLRAETGAPIIVNSGYRDPAYNRVVGGARRSLHLSFNALDIRSVEYSPRELYKLARKHELAEIGMALRYMTFIHIDTRGVLGRYVPNW